ncbi:Uncharacterized conserved protein YabE, contains G5 and tandem DUF348 domains [Jatrophihabitans endophyticus]|uniref:Uncharacterized conserved protein YabE, contains G5 and tandem DUF348 domains n=1 Tax=Jatrophihabitans endophyticus TaxID=1206085 RepID=A0A1M5U2Y1_9ACTN|nr:ubiquitin-like domain-containing protein [Jatrophihabitans endophyticus]SHH57308.1 Uncharacterized conserved protein YabE, contains G5 and tandem DUF348 domains [Jatrophihabitans endophyticus]
MLRSVKYGLYGAVLAGLVAAPVAWATVDKTVRLTVDGKATTVDTTAADVRGLLADEGFEVKSHDLVAPTTTSKVEDGMTVVLRRGRLLHLNVDGVPKNVWTTAPTVSVALAQLGYSSSDFVSVSRAKRLPLDPSAIAIRTPRLVTVVHDGEREAVSTTEATVRALLTKIRVLPDKDDRLSVPLSAATADGQTITLQRVGTRTLTRTVDVKYETSRHDDKKLTKGRTKILTSGRNGRSQITYSVVLVDGKETGRKVVRTIVVSEPRTRVVAVGTKKVVVAPATGTPDPGSAKAYARSLMSSKYGWGNDEYDCLVTMWNHESGWRVNAANPSGAYGIPQSLPGSKMSSAGPNWQTDYRTQVKWGLGYIQARYDTPCGAWGFWQAHNYY